LCNFTTGKLVPNNLNVSSEIFIKRIKNPDSKTAGIANPCRRSNYDGKDNLLSTCTRTYDDKNTLSEAASYKRDGSLDSKYKLKYTYDATGNCTSMSTYLDGKPQAITEWEVKYW